MEKYVYNLTDFAHRVSSDGGTTWENSDNLKKFSLPDIEPGAQEVSGYSGLNGTIQVIDWAAIGAMELSLTYATMPECQKVYSPEKQDHQLVWVEQYTDKNGNTGWMTYRVYITGMLKKIPGGDGSKGENSEKEFTYGINSYKLTRKATEEGAEDTVIIDYDPINKHLILGGVDFGSKLATALASF